MKRVVSSLRITCEAGVKHCEEEGVKHLSSQKSEAMHVSPFITSAPSRTSVSYERRVVSRPTGVVSK